MQVPALLPIVLLAAACAPAARYAVSGEVAGLRFGGAADSEIARCMLANDCPPEVRERIDRARARLTVGTPEKEGLRRAAEELSLDAAALLFAERVLADSRNRRFQDAYARELARVRAGESAPARPLTLLCAPGWFYKANPENGGDFRVVRERFEAAGIPTRLIAFDENGPVEANARAIADYVRAAPEGDYALLSASKSGPEAAYALGSLLSEEESKKVRAWINVAGVIGGSPLADRAFEFPRSWLVAFDAWKGGWSLDGARGMTSKASAARMRAARFPPELLILNYVGVPLSGNVTERGRDGYEEMAPDGPNDGLVLLAEAIVPGGATVLEPGVDHYVATPDVAERALAVYRTVVAALADDLNATPPESR